MAKKWEESEELFIVRKIMKDPHNLQQVFRESSTVLNRTPEAITFRYYTKIRNNNKLFMLVSSNYVGENSKNKAVTSKSCFRRILKKLFKQEK